MKPLRLWAAAAAAAVRASAGGDAGGEARRAGDAGGSVGAEGGREPGGVRLPGGDTRASCDGGTLGREPDPDSGSDSEDGSHGAVALPAPAAGAAEEGAMRPALEGSGGRKLPTSDPTAVARSAPVHTPVTGISVDAVLPAGTRRGGLAWAPPGAPFDGASSPERAGALTPRSPAPAPAPAPALAEVLPAPSAEPSPGPEAAAEALRAAAPPPAGLPVATALAAALALSLGAPLALDLRRAALSRCFPALRSAALATASMVGTPSLSARRSSCTACTTRSVDTSDPGDAPAARRTSLTRRCGTAAASRGRRFHSGSSWGSPMRRACWRRLLRCSSALRGASQGPT
mmetsp:Transcript_25993/g.97917  ORF Transcript_25993/g.97917 Transcript_25993/m.97917 type:complete len:345 (+) Transcript_25993:703-1737(+)